RPPTSTLFPYTTLFRSAGALTVGNLLFETAAKVGWFGTFTRTLGPQIRGGESAAMVRLTTEPSSCPDDFFKVFLAIDWKNIERLDRKSTRLNSSHVKIS